MPSTKPVADGERDGKFKKKNERDRPFQRKRTRGEKAERHEHGVAERVEDAVAVVLRRADRLAEHRDDPGEFSMTSQTALEARAVRRASASASAA